MGAIIVAGLALVGVIGTAIFSYMGQKQARESNRETNASTMARAEIELALESQGKRLADIHTQHKAEIEGMLAAHGREIELIRNRYEGELADLRDQVSLLKSREVIAEERAQQSEEKANESAEHAIRCDAALSELQREYSQLRARIEGMSHE